MKTVIAILTTITCIALANVSTASNRSFDFGFATISIPAEWALLSSQDNKAIAEKAKKLAPQYYSEKETKVRHLIASCRRAGHKLCILRLSSYADSMDEAVYAFKRGGTTQESVRQEIEGSVRELPNFIATESMQLANLKGLEAIEFKYLRYGVDQTIWHVTIYYFSLPNGRGATLTYSLDEKAPTNIKNELYQAVQSLTFN